MNFVLVTFKLYTTNHLLIYIYTSGLKLLFFASEEADSNTDEEFKPIAATHGRRKSDDFLKLNEDDWIK